jgi:mevalonate kinase
LRNIQIFIPGKIMLAGEYSVLHGGHALAATISSGMNINVTWHPHAAQWEIHSDLWTEPKLVSDDHTPQLDMLCRAVQYAAKRTGMHGGKVVVKSNLDVSYGVGSSSALRLGICAAFFAIVNGSNPSHQGGISLDAVHGAWHLQSEGQGIASGYDIVTQYAGGLVEFAFESADHKWRPSWFRHDLNGLSDIVHVFIGGRGAPTTATMQSTSAWLDVGNRFEKLLDVSESLVDAFNVAIKWPSAESMKRLNATCGAVRSIFSGSQNFPAEIAEKLSLISGLDQSWSWKTTGAGGEDAILLIGSRHAVRPAMMSLLEMGWSPLGHTFSMNSCLIASKSFSDAITVEPAGDKSSAEVSASTRALEREVTSDAPSHSKQGTISPAVKTRGQRSKPLFQGWLK